MAPGVIGAAHQRAGLDVTKAQLLGRHFELLKLFRRHVAFDFKLAIRRLQILADGDDVDVVVRANLAAWP